jgi:8-oxo-dGTP pyrophosphatase MutT (NUDIX family)
MPVRQLHDRYALQVPGTDRVMRAALQSPSMPVMEPPRLPGPDSPAPPGRRPAAVLIPIYPTPDGPHVVIIRRTTRGRHAGQHAFPGGRPEPEDADLRATALREAHEEVGIVPTDVTVLAPLPVVETIVTNYAISTFVGILDRRPDMVAQPDEVAEILEVPLAALMDDRLPLVEDWDLPLPGEPWTAPAPDAPPEQRRRTIRYYPWKGHRIWGATARMIEHLVTAIREGRIAVPAHA